MTSDELKPIAPQEAQALYWEERKEDAAYETLDTIRRGTSLFVDWCEVQEITNMNTLSGRDLIRFKSWCKANSEKNKISLNGLLAVLRRFLVFCVKIDAVDPAIPDKVPISDVSDDEEVCYEKPPDEQVTRVTRYLQRYEPASRRHVEYAIMKEIGNRVGALRGIDVKDFDLEERKIVFKHRPYKENDAVKGTPLKNGSDGHRSVNISCELADLIEGYLENPDRPDVTDEFGRTPLLTTKNGRPSTKTIRQDLYKLTRPCEYADHCPHDRDINSCEAAKNNHASKCPSSHSPHPLRRWSIEHQIDRGVPKEELVDRVDVSVPVLNQHYDHRSEERKRKKRLKTLEKLFEGYGDPEATLDTEEIDAITNDDGMIDAVALKQIIAKTEQLEEVVPTYSDSSDDEQPEEQPEKGQCSFDDFTDGPAALTQPALVPVIAGAVVGKWVPNRLRREFHSMAPDSVDSPWPSRGRAAKGLGAYALYVCLVAMNLTLLGVLPV